MTMSNEVFVPEVGDLCVCTCYSKLGKEERAFIFLSTQGENHYLLEEIETQRVFASNVNDVVFLDPNWHPLYATNIKHPLLAKEPGAWLNSLPAGEQRTVIISGDYRNGSLIKNLFYKYQGMSSFFDGGRLQWPTSSTKGTGLCF